MREHHTKNGYTQVDHVTLDLILPHLTPPAQLIYLRIYRQTIGWKRRSDKIAHSKFAEYTGYTSHQTISKAVEELVGHNLISVSGEKRQIKEYTLITQTILDVEDGKIITLKI